MTSLVRQRLSYYRPAAIETDRSIRAAVLIPIYENTTGTQIILTKRTTTVRYHKGEISFPGGMYEDNDGDTRMTALRECCEEIGVNTTDIETIGRLDDMETVTGFVITPYVGVIPYPYEFSLNPDEVHFLIYLPLVHLLSTEVSVEAVAHQGRTFHVPTFYYEGNRIWGATCRMLLSLRQIVSHEKV